MLGKLRAAPRPAPLTIVAMTLVVFALGGFTLVAPGRTATSSPVGAVAYGTVEDGLVDPSASQNVNSVSTATLGGLALEGATCIDASVPVRNVVASLDSRDLDIPSGVSADIRISATTVVPSGCPAGTDAYVATFDDSGFVEKSFSFVLN
jgi:hypothetical protein